MTWREAQLTLQLAGEERVGFVMRERARMARAREDAAFEAAAMAAQQVTSGDR